MLFRLQNNKSFYICVLLLLLGKTNLVYAYLDPGSISLAIQGLIAAVAGLAVTFRYWYWRLLNFLGFGKKVNESDEPGLNSHKDE